MIAIVDDDKLMAKCVRRACEQACPGEEVRVYADGVALMAELEGELPRLIVLDMLLTGVNGVAILHELASYEDTAKIPVIMISTLNLAEYDLREYGVIKVFDKGNMTPAELREAVKKGCDQRVAEVGCRDCCNFYNNGVKKVRNGGMGDV